MFLAIFLLLLGFAILIKGADFLVSGSASIAKGFRISNLAIGLTVVAFGTSTPELLVNIMSTSRDLSDAAFGNIIGSNNFNLLCILGIAGILHPLTVQRNTVKIEIPVSLAAALLTFVLLNDVLVFGKTTNMLSRTDSLLLLVVFFGFMFYIFKTMTNTDTTTDAEIRIYSKTKSWLLVILGLGMLVGGGNLVVDNAVWIAMQFGWSEKLIGLTILAAGTSLPELATSAVAAFKKNTDIAIGNVVGSNIFNLLFILGFTGLVHESPYNDALNTDMYILFAGTIVLIICMFTLKKRQLDRWEAAILLAGYIAYTTYLIRFDQV